MKKLIVIGGGIGIVSLLLFLKGLFFKKEDSKVITKTSDDSRDVTETAFD